MADASIQRPAPSATGDVASRPLLHLLVYARNRRLSGKLDIHAEDGRSGTIELWRGRISGARTAPPVAFFGTVAYDVGFIDTPTLDATLLEISKTKRLHGEVLVESGALTAAQRDEVLSEQACRKIHHLFTFPPEATFSFYDERPSAEEPPLTLDPIKPAWRGLRDHPPTDSVREVLDRYASIPLRLTSESPITSTAFSPDEASLCEALAFRSMTIAQMRNSASSTLPSNRVELLAYLLVIAKCAEPAPASSPSMPAVRTSVPAAPISTPRIEVGPPSSRSNPSMPRTVMTPNGPVRPDSRTMRAANMAALDSGERRVSLSFRVGPSNGPPSSSRSVVPPVLPLFSPSELGAAGIAHRAQSLDTEDFFEALGLPDEATADAARAAYFRLAKVWHPDRLPPDLEPFRAECEKIFAHMTRASATLTDADARQAYIETRDQNAAATTIAAKPRKDVIRDIDTAIGKREFLIAEQTARHLMSLDSDDAEAQALAAWALIQAGEAPEEVLRTALPELDKAVHKDTYCERAHFYRGVVHKRLGSSAAAFRDFTRVTQINPKHVDAQREIRIFEMRARKGSGEHALEALISKTKKK